MPPVSADGHTPTLAGLTMLASLWLCLADPTLCHALLVDRNKHVFLARRLALV